MAIRVILDAGHGGWDNGATYMGRKEKDENLSLALAVGSLLQKEGVDVVYTRKTDIYQTPDRKAVIANDADGDYFISFHRNATDQPNGFQGVETIVYEDTGKAGRLAKRINKNLEESGFVNLGTIEQTNLPVLRKTKMPAVLIETGFIDSDKDNNIFNEKFGEIAEGIAQAILENAEAESGKRDESMDLIRPSFFYRIQVGLFRKYDNAMRLARELESMGFTVEVTEMDGYYAVLVGRFDRMERAERIERVLQEDGYETLLIAI